MRIATLLITLTVGAALLLGSGTDVHADDAVAVRAEQIHIGDGTHIDNGVVLVQNGKIVAVGPSIAIPDGTRVIEAGSVTPGFIDAASNAGIRETESWAEHSSEVIPHMRTLDAVDLTHRSFDEMVRHGVTTIFVTSDTASVIGSRGTVVKTDRLGKGQRVLVDTSEPMMSITMETWSRGVFNNTPFGSAVSFNTRRPTTGMGNSWVVREAFYSAANAGDEADAAQAELVKLMKGEGRLRIFARRRHDILTGIRLAHEFGVTNLAVVEGIEASRIADTLAELSIPVIYGPMFETPLGRWRARSGEASEPNLASARILSEAGVKLALTAGDLRGENSLPRQATFAMRYGLSRDAAVMATTKTPAELLGVADRVGTIAIGMDADLVAWSGAPFDATSAIDAVIVDGRVAHSRNQGTN